MTPDQCADEQVFSGKDDRFLFLSNRLARFNLGLSARQAQRLADEFRSRYGSPWVDEKSLGEGETIKTLSWSDGRTALDVVTLGSNLASLNILDTEAQRARAVQLERERAREQAEQAKVANLEANPPYQANILGTTWMYPSVLDAAAFFSADLDTQASMRSRGFGAAFEHAQEGESVTVEFFYDRRTGERGGKPTTDPSYAFITTAEGKEGYILDTLVGPPIVSHAASK